MTENNNVSLVTKAPWYKEAAGVVGVLTWLVIVGIFAWLVITGREIDGFMAVQIFVLVAIGTYTGLSRASNPKITTKRIK